MKMLVIAVFCIYAAGCSQCKQPQAVETHKELDTSMALSLASLPNLPKIELRTAFSRKADSIFKVTPGVDALDHMLYRICVMADRHRERITPQLEFDMQKEAYNTWLKYVKGLERVAAEKVKAELAAKPFGEPKVTTSAAVPKDLQQRVRGAMLKMLELEKRGEP